MTNSKIIDFVEGLGVYKTKLAIYVKNHHPDVYTEIHEKTRFLDENNPKEWKITFAERLYCIKNGLTQRKTCEDCDNPVEFRTDVGEYRRYCSCACSRTSDGTKARREKTNSDLHGDPHYTNIPKARQTRAGKNDGAWHAPDFLSKVEATLLNDHGDPHWNNQELRKQTCTKTYGVDHHMKDEETKTRTIQQFMETHNGLSCNFQLPELRQMARENRRNHAWKTIHERLGETELAMTREEFNTIVDLNDNGCLKLKCKTCGTEFTSNWDNGRFNRQCPVCFPELHGTSKQENELLAFIKSVYAGQVLSHEKENRQIIPPKDIDIWLPEKKIAIEYDGLYWHSEADGKPKDYHLKKTEECEQKGITLLHVFENEWLSKRDIVESRLLNALGSYSKTVYARKCALTEPDRHTAINFLDENHIQGSIKQGVSVGLEFENELVALMTFGKCRFSKKYEWELTRFCVKLGWHIPGAAGKLLNEFERKFSPKSLVSYADRRWSRGKLYKALGFELDHASPPNYWYFKLNDTTVVYNRVMFQKHTLEKKLKVFDPNMTEVENMKANRYSRIFDCGNLVFVKEY